MWSIIREYGLNTSAHGVPGIARSVNLVNRIFWILSTLVFSGVMIYFVVESIRNFLLYPTQIQVSVIDTLNLPFPAVTVCNYCPFRYDLFMDDYSNYTKEIMHRNDTNGSETLSEIERKYMRNFIYERINKNVSINHYFFQLEDMLLSCKFNGIQCDKNDFATFIDSRYGRCYSFNVPPISNPNKTIYKLSENGSWGFLEMEFYIHSHQYVPYWSSGTVKIP